MVHFTNLALASISAASVLAMPASSQLDTRASCTFSGSTGAAAAKAGKASCSAIVLSNVVVPAGTTLDLTGLKSGTTVTFEGTTTFGYKEWEGPLISVSGTSITVKGASGSVINADGARWWDGKGGNGGKTKPKFFYAHSLTTSTISGLTLKNSPVQVFSINGAKGLTVSGVTIDNSAGDALGSDGKALAHNTDAFDVGSSSNVIISGANVKNQDDCLAVNSGTDITFSGGTCSGGHGISIGSVGGRDNNVVSGVTIKDSKILNSDNGVRIKTVYGATGSVSGVSYTNIALTNIAKYGIVIEQDYENGSPTGKPTAGVPITGLTISGVTGTVKSSGTDVYILCASGACKNWTWKNVSITGGKKSTACSGIPTGASC